METIPDCAGDLVAIVFSLSIRPVHQPFDYTYRIAGTFLDGHLGLNSQPPTWLNEMVPMGGKYYSVFPLGAVLSVLPVALLGEAGFVNRFPGGIVASLIAGLSVYFFYQLAGLEQISKPRRILLALFPVFGTWSWCNLGFGGAWQIALGFALLGQIAALYFTFILRGHFSQAPVLLWPLEIAPSSFLLFPSISTFGAHCLASTCQRGRIKAPRKSDRNAFRPRIASRLVENIGLVSRNPGCAWSLHGGL